MTRGPSGQLDRRAALLFGGLFVLVGIGVITMITLSPEGLRAPYWVAVAASATFSFAGLAIIAQAFGLARFGRWLAVCVLLGLAAPGLWILLDPAEKSCSGSIGVGGASLTTGAGDLMCRAVFGFGGALTLLVTLFLVVALFRRKVQRRSEREQTDTQQPER